MDSHSMNRKDFLKLTVTLIGGATVASACSSSNSNGGSGGSNGSGGSSGSGAGGSNGAGGGSVDAKAVTGPANMCAVSLPTMQLADSTGHTHMLVILSSRLASTSDQMLLTSGYPPSGSGGHFHTVTLTVADLATLSGGGSFTKTSSIESDPAHSHMFMISCKGD